MALSLINMYTCTWFTASNNYEISTILDILLMNKVKLMKQYEYANIEIKQIFLNEIWPFILGANHGLNNYFNVVFVYVHIWNLLKILVSYSMKISTLSPILTILTL